MLHYCKHISFKIYSELCEANWTSTMSRQSVLRWTKNSKITKLKFKGLCSVEAPSLYWRTKGHPCEIAKSVTKNKNCDNHKILEMLIIEKTWVYYYELQSHVNNKLWLNKDEIRSPIAKQLKRMGKVLYSTFLMLKDLSFNLQ